MAIGKTVRVWRRAAAETDPMGANVYTWACEDVGNVLVRPVAGSEDSADNSIRHESSRIRFRLAFPKTFTGGLRGARVSLIDEPWRMDAEPAVDGGVPDDALDVLGDPQREDPCPTQWNLLAEIGRYDG